MWRIGKGSAVEPYDRKMGDSVHYGWIILLFGVFAVLGALGFARFGYTMIFPSMMEGLAMNDVQAADLATGYMIGYLTLSVIGGILASRFGPRVIIGIFLMVITGSLLMTFPI